MAINLAPLENGLQQVNTGIAPGDRQGDSLRTFAEKFNKNAEITLTEKDNLAGTGLSWDELTRKLSISAPAKHVLYGSQLVPANEEEFEVNSGIFTIKLIDGSKIRGTVGTSRLELPSFSVPVGNVQGVARPVALNQDEFTIDGEVLTLNEVPFSKIVGFEVEVEDLPLNNNSIYVGNAANKARQILLASEDFSVTNDNRLVLRQSLDSAVTLSKIDAENDYGPGSLLGVNETEDSLRWVDPLEAIEIAIDSYIDLRGSTTELYVNPIVGNDSLSNAGTSPLRPFRTIQRALLEVVRNSYIVGQGRLRTDPGTDTFDRTVIRLSPGVYELNNAPGNPSLTGYTLPATATQLDPAYISALNSLDGGIIIPRGCSFAGSDLRKVKIYPTFVPDTDPGTETGTVPIFRITGGSYIEKLTFIDNPSITRSHHRVTAFEFASLQDLEQYYAKVYDMFRLIDEYSDVGGLNLEPVNEESEIVVDASNATATYPGTNFRKADDVYGSSPYIFNCSVRSRFGMCGLVADGARVSGLKSIVSAQFTNVSLQVDPQAFEVDPHNPMEGLRYKADYRHFAFKATNDAYMQLVSCFVVGDAVHYITENGGDLSITNSTSNFGELSLYATGASPNVLSKDVGIELLGIVPPLPIIAEPQVLTIATLGLRITPRFTLQENDTRSPEQIYGALDRISISSVNSIDPYKLTPGNIVHLTVVSSIPQIIDSITFDLVVRAQDGKVIDTVVGQNGVVSEAFLYVEPASNELAKFATCTLPGLDILPDLNGNPQYPYWYDRSLDFQPNGDPVTNNRVTYEQQRRNEADRRVLMLLANNGTPLTTTKTADRRDDKDKFFRVILRATGNQRKPVENFLIDHPMLRQPGDPNRRKNDYFVTDIVEIPNTVSFEGRQTGRLYSAYLLRGNISNEDPRPEYVEDVKVSQAYRDLVNAIDLTQETEESLLEKSISEDDQCLIALRRFLTDLGFSAGEIAGLTAPSSESTNITIRTNIMISKPGVTSSNQLLINFIKPSIIRASNHTWEWVGYRNYSTAIPRFQPTELSREKALQALQQALRGGRIYATGMNELGEFFVGNRSINLRTGQESEVRFDSSQQNLAIFNPNFSASFNRPQIIRNFTNLEILDTLTADKGVFNRLLVKQTFALGLSCGFSVSTTGNVNQVAPITDSTNSAAKATETTYGLTRYASQVETEQGISEGVVRARNLDNWGTNKLGIDLKNRFKAVQLGNLGQVFPLTSVYLGTDSQAQSPVIQLGSDYKGFLFNQKDLGLLGENRWNGWQNTNAFGRRFVSTGGPSGGIDGDIWYQVVEEQLIPLPAPVPGDGTTPGAGDVEFYPPQVQGTGQFAVDGIVYRLQGDSSVIGGEVIQQPNRLATVNTNAAQATSSYIPNVGLGFFYLGDVLNDNQGVRERVIPFVVLDPNGMNFEVSVFGGSTEWPNSPLRTIDNSGGAVRRKVRLPRGSYSIRITQSSIILTAGANDGLVGARFINPQSLILDPNSRAARVQDRVVYSGLSSFNALTNFRLYGQVEVLGENRTIDFSFANLYGLTNVSNLPTQAGVLDRIKAGDTATLDITPVDANGSALGPNGLLMTSRGSTSTTSSYIVRLLYRPGPNSPFQNPAPGTYRWRPNYTDSTFGGLIRATSSTLTSGYASLSNPPFGFTEPNFIKVGTPLITQVLPDANLSTLLSGATVFLSRRVDENSVDDRVARLVTGPANPNFNFGTTATSAAAAGVAALASYDQMPYIIIKPVLN